MLLGISFGNRDDGTTILDFETDDNADNSISDGEYSDDDSQSDDDNNLSNDEYVTAKEDNIESSEDESDDDDDDADADDDVDDNENDDNGDIDQYDIDDDDTDDGSVAWEDEDNKYDIQGAHFDDDGQLTVGVLSDNNIHENIGVSGRRSSRDHQEPEQFVAEPASRRRSRGVFTQMGVVFLRAVDQYQKIEASVSTKQYGMAAGLKIFGANGYHCVAR